jgi:hypothetical protein
VTTARRALGRSAAIAVAFALGGCAHEIGFHPEYLPQEPPPYIAQGKLLIVMPEEQQRFIYEGPPSSTTGDYSTLVVPVGTMVEETARHVFGDCFAYGVEIADSREGHDDYVLAIEGNMQELIYSYTKVIEAGFDDEVANTWIVPEVEVAFAVKAYNRAGQTVLDKVYDSGVTAGEEYMVTSKPEERINRVLHSTLHALMVELVADVRPLLMEECKVTDLAAATATSP